ncbi:hypothetical protein pdul_cds_609 [Pandoravirus dulcis]|uniref:Uncharacterized protein n=1 Tax=Pandoravirus dulcis TaxID=1349409 RepID=S4VXW1_9VIRU|nr:hypothetical protein pdul_cds_609 [Pandoravirus dulcis]AGO82734.1 hypothetical protein pdul_cds_609 [Pandoravirus dulcis]
MNAVKAPTPSETLAHHQRLMWALIGVLALLAAVLGVLYWEQRSRANPPGFKPCRPACAAADVCVDGTCRAPTFTCADAEDCPRCTNCTQTGVGAAAAYHCVPVAGCCGGKTCALGQYCVDGQCRLIPGACRVDADCASTRRCDAATATCVPR